MNNELKQIKKKYGERMMHLCRELFPTILNDEGKLIEILDSKFGHPKYLCADIRRKNYEYEFKNYIYQLYDNERENKKTDKTPFELMKEAGYTLYECLTDEDIQSFKKYYREDEELCTFRQNRLKNSYVFFAVKDDVDNIKREDFPHPERQDKYGTSVISIQFTRGKTNTLSIKNRYNHTVPHPDATFANNLENIIPGFTDSFTKYYKYNINQSSENSFDLGYVLANDGKYYKYNMEIDNVYYCPDNIIINNFEVDRNFIDKEKYLVIDYFILNLQNKPYNIPYNVPIIESKSINLYDMSLYDSFVNHLHNFNKIIIHKTERNTRLIELIKHDQKSIYIEIDKLNNIVGYTNENIEVIDNSFMTYNSKLQHISMDSVTKIGKKFLYCNSSLKNLSLPNVIEIDDNFLRNCTTIKTIRLDKAIHIKDECLTNATKLEYIYAPNLETIGHNFLTCGFKLKSLQFDKVISVGDSFMVHNYDLEYLYMPNLITVGNSFLYLNKKIRQIDLPKLETIGHEFFAANKQCEYVNLPCVKEIGGSFLSHSRCREANLSSVEIIKGNFLHDAELTEKVYMPNVREIGTGFMSKNKCLKELYLPKVKSIGHSFLQLNEVLDQLYIPKCQEIGNYSLTYNNNLKYLYLPEVKQIGCNVLYNNNQLKYLYAPNLTEIDYQFLYNNNTLRYLYLPSVESIHGGFLDNNSVLKILYIPKLNYAPFSFEEKIKELKNKDKKFVYKLSKKYY